MHTLIFTFGMAYANSINPPEGSLWDFIESNAIRQALREQDRSTTNDNIVKDIKPLPTFLAGQLISSEEKNYYKDPFEVLKHDPLYIDLIDPKDFDIPIVVNDDVKRWMVYMLGAGRKHYSKWLTRSTKYTPILESKLEASGLPKDLIYLSMIESGFSTSAYSSAAAVGLWQFIPATGREMGLRIDWWIDERRDPEKSTDAAIKYLSYLHRQFGHWYLAWAGYNGGPGRVSRALTKHGSDDFWTLVERNAFPSETDNYVPKIIAAAIIGKYRDRYGFSDTKYAEKPEYEYVTVGANAGVDVLAKCAGLSESEFLAINPELLRWSLPPSPSRQKIKVPDGKSFLVELAKIPPADRVTAHRHVVKKGETLGLIARKYGVSVTSIQKVNKITNPNRISVGTVLMIPGASASDKTYVSTKNATKNKKSKSSKSKKTTLIYHQVKRGENLSLIGKKYGVSTADIKRWNKISNANRIYPGQKLKIYTSNVIWTTYTVKSGDNLTYIAKKHKCTVEEIKSWNNLKSAKIYPGQKLKIQK